MSDIKKMIRAFIVENFLFGSDEGLTDSSSFMEEGIIDSTGILELIDFVEGNYDISVEDEEMIPENLDSINNLVAYVERKS